jgi:peptidoglycan/LPS O-acetylase OafA/YrhL
MIFPALIEKKLALKCPLSMRLILLYDWRLFYQMAFPAYICHYLIIFWYYASGTSNTDISIGLTMRIAVATVFFSYLAGFLIYLLIDKPIRNLDKMVLFPTKLSDSFLVKRKSKSPFKRQ